MKLSSDVTDSPRFTCFSDRVLPSLLLISTFSMPDCTMNTLSSMSPSARDEKRMITINFHFAISQSHATLALTDLEEQFVCVQRNDFRVFA